MPGTCNRCGLACTGPTCASCLGWTLGQAVTDELTSMALDLDREIEAQRRRLAARGGWSALLAKWLGLSALVLAVVRFALLIVNVC